MIFSVYMIVKICSIKVSVANNAICELRSFVVSYLQMEIGIG